MRVLVTGASGFVGRRLVWRLVQDHYKVVATYRRETRDPPLGYVQWHRVPEIGPDTDWELLLVDVDAVIHLAALAHQIEHHGEGRLQEFLSVNALGTKALAVACRRAANVRRFILVSSIGAVASASQTMLDERTQCQPATDYGRSKREAELLVARVLAGSQISWSILRPPLIYGPGNPGNMARLINLLAQGRPLPFGAIRNRRSFIYVENFVDALVRCLSHPSSNAETFFVTDGTELSTAELSTLLAKYMSVQPRLWRVPLWMLRLAGSCGDTLQGMLGRSVGIDSYAIDRLTGSLWADGRKFRKMFDWQPPFGPEQGIQDTCAEFASRVTRGHSA